MWPRYLGILSGMARNDFIEEEHPRGHAGKFTEKDRPQAEVPDVPSVDLEGQRLSSPAGIQGHDEHIPL